MSKIHYRLNTFVNQAACGRYVDSLSKLPSDSDPAKVTCLACLKRM